MKYNDGIYRIWRDRAENDLTDEIWKECLENPLYQVSSLGRFRVSIYSDIEDTKYFYKGKIITQNKMSKNKPYLRATLRKLVGKGNGAVSSHRAVAHCFVEGKTLERQQINHKDANPENNHFTNLEWCTPLENRAHAEKMGLTWVWCGEDRIEAKLTEIQVFEILREYFYDFTLLKDIANKYSMHPEYISLITRGKRWKIQYEQFVESNKDHYNKVYKILMKRNGNNTHKFNDRIKEALNDI